MSKPESWAVLKAFLIQFVGGKFRCPMTVERVLLPVLLFRISIFTLIEMSVVTQSLFLCLQSTLYEYISLY